MESAWVVRFKVLKKRRGKLACLILEMLIIRNKRTNLNTQADAIRAKLSIFKIVSLLHFHASI